MVKRPMAVSFTPLQLTLGIAHGDLRLVCVCSAMESHSMKLLTNSYCADIASIGSLELGVEFCNQDRLFLHAMCLKIPLSAAPYSYMFPLHSNSTYS